MAKTIRRRAFLKYGAAGAGFLTLSHLLGRTLLADKNDDRPFVDRCTGKKVEGRLTTCTGCGAGCGIIAYVSGGELMNIGGNPAHPVNEGRLCLVGEAGLYTLYDPERVLAPRVRIGRRGEGRFKEISWEEALETLAGKIKAYRRRGLILETRGGSTGQASKEFLAGMGGGTLVSHGSVVSPNREAALSGMFGARFDIPDIRHTSYILNFGANPYESDPFGMSTIKAISERRGRREGLKLVTFDPRLSATAGRSDEWFPLLPGTDALVALAMANVIMSEGLYDRDFIESHTDTTAERLKEHLATYTPSSAERVSGVSMDDISRIAVEYATTERAVLMTGGGVSKHAHGTMNERAVRLLPVITGKVERRGCNLLPSWSAADAPGGVTPERLHRELQDGARRTGVYILHGSDPAYSSPASGMMGKVLRDESAIPFLVSIDTHVTDSGRYADLVLPMTTYLEEYGLEVSPGPGAAPVVGYRQPVVPPAGESMPYPDILCAVAEKAGTRLSFSDSEDYAEAMARKVDCMSSQAAQALPEKGYAACPGPRTGLKAKIAVTSGKGSLPSFTHPGEYKDMGPESLALVTYSPAAYREGFTENNLFLKEIAHTNRAVINSNTGASMGLKNWDKVELVSPAGKIEAEVLLSPGINPKTVALARGCGHSGYGNIENAERFKSPDPFTEVIWWHEEGSGVNPNDIIPFNIDPESGGQGWMLTRITLEKTRGAKNG